MKKASPSPRAPRALPVPRGLRADAKQNEDRLLEASARAFAREGTQASLKAIAEDAGVGIGTLYRRFPTREALVAATYRSEVDRICAKATKLLATKKPAPALRAWLGAFVEFLTAKQGMADVLRAVLANEDEFRAATRARLTEALALLMGAARATGDVRADTSPTDVIMAAGGIALIAGGPDQHEQAGRLLDLLFDGLRFNG